MKLRNIGEVQLRLGREMHMTRDVCRERIWKAGPWRAQKEIKSP
jgi:hypothetical protein